MLVFLDTNVLFSACLRPDDRQYALFRIARARGCRLVASAWVLEEAQRNLKRKAPLVEIALDVPAELVAAAAALGLPAKDAPILAAAVSAGADLLVTGDRRHFGPLFGQVVQGVRIAALAEGLALVTEAAGRGA